ncbi:ChaN family lipoprotein [Phycisphaeraceae bacterium AH-315-B13]|nr:ChaN family lipoprotein [Phycisphaeraceae bacterium AH-315-B13]
MCALAVITACIAWPAALLADDLATLPLGDPQLAFDIRSGVPGTIFDTASDAAIDFDALIADLADADVVILGEHHTSDDVHQMQARIFDALVEQGKHNGRTYVLGMEFLNIQQSELLDSYVAGELTTEQLIDDASWYTQAGYSFAYFRSLFETARDNGAPIRGLNVPRPWVRDSMRGALTDEQNAAIGPLADIHPAHRYMVADMMDMSADGAAMMMPVQRMWDAAMAHSSVAAINEFAPKDVTVVVIVGIGHAAHGHGIPERIAVADPSLTVRVVAPVIAVKPDPKAPVHPGFEPKEQAVFSRGFADYVYILPDREGVEVYANAGIRFESDDPETGATISRLRGPAARANLEVGDVLLGIMGEPITNGQHARQTLAELTWDQRIELQISRDGSEMTIPLLLVPPAEGPLDWLISEPLNRAMFSPLSDASALDEIAPASDEAKRQMLLVSTNNNQRLPRRVDVLENDRLVEVWFLDDKGLTTRGLRAVPDASNNGAVKFQIKRDEGRLVSYETFGTNGDLIQVKPADH